MKRNGLVFGVMVVGIALLLWAGWHNLRERRLAMQQAQENHVVLAPDKAGSAAQTDSQSPEAEAMQMRGKAAPAFTLVTLDGKKVSLSDYKGRPVLVNFWATWCGPCKVEMPWFEEFNKQYAAQGFVILGLADDVDAGKDTIAKVAQEDRRHLSDSADRWQGPEGVCAGRNGLSADVVLRRSQRRHRRGDGRTWRQG